VKAGPAALPSPASKLIRNDKAAMQGLGSTITTTFSDASSAMNG
jgi:hypothetical protein